MRTGTASARAASKRRCITLISALLLIARSASAGGDVAFQPPLLVPFPAGSVPWSLLVEDLTGDGTADLLVALHGQHAVIARTGMGGLQFAPAISSPLPAFVAEAWALGDMDGDGLPDLVASLDEAPHAVHVLASGGDGLFTESGVLPLVGSSFILGVPVLDANLDGSLDVAVMEGNAVHVALGDGAGGLLPAGPPVTSGLSSLRYVHEAAELDGDGDPDLLATCIDGFGFGWTTFSNDGSGQFLATPFHGSPDAELQRGAVGNLDGDAWPDLVVPFVDYPFFYEDGSLQLAHGDGTTVSGSYPADVLVTDDIYWDSALGDFDGDGLDELAGSQYLNPGTHVFVHPNDGGHLLPALDFPMGKVVSELQSGDMDGDGRLDLVVLHFLDDAVSILVNDILPPGWSAMAGALPGRSGEPQLAGAGVLDAGAEVEIRLSNALPNAPAWLVMGSMASPLPFKGGTLVPSADAVLAGLVVNANGGLALNAHWPPGVPSGFEVWMQALIADAAGAAGFAASNAVVAKTEP